MYNMYGHGRPPGRISEYAMQLLSGVIEGIPIPSAAVFSERYARPNQPVVLAGAAAGWRARSLWTLDWMQQRIGALPVPEYAPKTVADLADEVRQAMRIAPMLAPQDVYGRPQVAVDITRVRELRDDFNFPSFHSPDPLCRIQLWFGPAGTRTNLHYDLCLNLFAQLEGRKRFQLYLPAEIPRFGPVNRFPLFAEFQSDTPKRCLSVEDAVATDPVQPALDLVLDPGDILFIPYRWLHRVTSLEAQRSLSIRWLTVSMALCRIPPMALHSLRCAFSRRR
jgi:hypothetical protein